MTYADEVTLDNPLLWWRFDEVSGTSVVDASGNARTGTYEGGPPLEQPGALVGDPSASVYFGLSDRVRIARQPEFSRGITSLATTATGYLSVEFWFRSTIRPTTGARTLAAFWRANHGSWTNWRITSRPDQGVRMYQTGGGGEITADVDIWDGNWHHIVAEWDSINSVRNLYVGGVLRLTDTTTMGTAYYVHGDPMYLLIGDVVDRVDAYYDEFALYNHLLGPERVAAHWWAGRQGHLTAVAVDLGITVGTAHIGIGQHVPATGINLGLTVGHHALTEPVTPLSIESLNEFPGPVAPRVRGTIYPASIESDPEVPGPVHPPTLSETGPLRPGSIGTLNSVPGPNLPVPVDPVPSPSNPNPPPKVRQVPMPGSPGESFFIDASMKVTGESKLLAATCTPVLSGTGSGNFTVRRPGPNLDEVKGFSVAGSRVMTGHVASVTDHEVSPDEEDGERVEVTVRSTIHELSHIKILPDFGSMDLERLGPPTQDQRVYDWTANGLGDWSGQYQVGEAMLLPAAVTTVGMEVLYADKNNYFPIPDVWPDPLSEWMWTSSQIGGNPREWVLMRVPSHKPPEGPVQFWLAAHDYAELWVDGVKLLTCDTPGVSQYVQVENTRNDWHLVAIRAYTPGPFGGVMFSMLPVKANGLYGKPVLRSSGGWWGSTTDEPYVYTPGAVVERVLYEAKERGNTIAPKWELTFTRSHDSSGEPWEPGRVIEHDVGISVLELLDILAEDRVEFAEGPAGWRLDMWNKDQGSGHQVSMPWSSTLGSRDVDRTAKL